MSDCEETHTSLDRKGSRFMGGRRDICKKRLFHGNQYTKKSKVELNASASAKKLKVSAALDVDIDRAHGYVIVNFLSVFTAIASLVKCKICNSDVKISETGFRGLGFTLVIKCEKCEQKEISSSPSPKSYCYEINRSFTLAMRVLGVGLTGMNIFCGIMNLPKCFSQTLYDKITKKIRDAAKEVADSSMRMAADEEKKITAENGNTKDANGIAVFGDGSWRKIGFSSLQGVATLIGLLSGKVVDVIVKSSFCKACQSWSGKMGAEEYEEWYAEHEDKCTSNHEGSFGKMEVHGMVEMFGRSEDAKTFKSITEAHPYGENIMIRKRKCIGHV